MRFWILLMLCVAALVAPMTVHAQTPSAVTGHLLDIHGRVEVIRAGRTVPAVERYRLLLNDKVLVALGASATAMHYGSSTHYLLRGPGVFLVEPNRLSLKGAEAKVLKRATRLPAITQSPSANQKQLILGTYLRNSGVLSHPDPIGAMYAPGTLRWKNDLPAEKYPDVHLQLTITSVGEKANSEGEKEPILTEELPVSGSEFSLEPGKLEIGKIYRWKVKVQLSTGQMYETGGKFFLLSEEEVAQVKLLEAQAADLRKSMPDSVAADFWLANGYKNVGLFALALEHYRAALTKEPDNVELQDGMKEMAGALNELTQPELPAKPSDENTTVAPH